MQFENQMKLGQTVQKSPDKRKYENKLDWISQEIWFWLARAFGSSSLMIATLNNMDAEYIVLSCS